MDKKTKEKKEKTYWQIVLQMLKEMVIATIVMIIVAPFIMPLFFKNDEKSNEENKEYQLTELYSGEYDSQKKVVEDLPETRDLDGLLCIMNYQEYIDFCKKYNLTQKYFDTEKRYITYCTTTYIEPTAEVLFPTVACKLMDVEYEENKVNLYIKSDFIGIEQNEKGLTIHLMFIPTSENVKEVYIKSVINADMSAAKPIIYLYPEMKTEINVKLGYPENITCSYPKYPNEGWKVEAEPNGDLKYIKNQRELYSLYYENKTKIDFKVENDGFVVKSEDTAQFLEEKLEILGLNSKEAEEFIIYWLPRLEESNYNYIRFATEKEIEENMPLNINPVPDTTIRVLMIYKGLEEPIQINEQELTSPERTGYIAVEWGGVDLK